MRNRHAGYLAPVTALAMRATEGPKQTFKLPAVSA